MDESRKQFEQYVAGRLGLPLEMISDARNGDRYMHAFDSMSVMQPINGWWTLWQESRAAIEIKLPPKAESSPYEHYMPQYTMDAESVESAIRAAGIKVKE